MARARVEPTLSRRAAQRAAVRNSPNLAPIRYTADLALRKGKCRACGNRWAAVRITLDLTSYMMQERIAQLECARCGHVWRRVAATMPVSRAGVQRVRLTILEPASGRVIRRTGRGRIVATGEDVATLTDATLGEADDAVRAWRARVDATLARRERAAERRAAADLILRERMAARMAQWAERDAARAADEAAALAREAAYAA